MIISSNKDTSRSVFLSLPQEGGGTLNVSAYVGLGPASTLHPQKISGISNTPNFVLKF